MKAFRLPKGTTARYTSFEELAKAFGRKPIKKQTSDKEKLAKQREDFCNKHVCEACKSPMTYIGGNQMVCANEKCKGIKHERQNELGETIVWYTTSYDLLDRKGAEIANNIFS